MPTNEFGFVLNYNTFIHIDKLHVGNNLLSAFPCLLRNAATWPHILRYLLSVPAWLVLVMEPVRLTPYRCRFGRCSRRGGRHEGVEVGKKLGKCSCSEDCDVR